MKYVFCFLMFFAVKLFAQPPLPVVQSHSSNSITILSQEKINEIKSPADGFMVLNSTTGCINYVSNQRWHELCGNCLPKPEPVKVDSIFQKGMSIYVYFKTKEKEVVDIEIASLKFKKRFNSSPAIISLYGLGSEEYLPVRVLGANDCGIETTSDKNLYNVKVDKKNISDVYITLIDNVQYNVRDVNGVTWMVNDFSPLKNPSGNVAKKLFTINQNENICPADWALPTIKDWEEYLKLFPENLLLAYEKAAKDNMSINLSKDGFFSTKENKLYFENEIGMYWTNKNENGKAFLVNMTNNGYMIVSEKSELIGAKIRCVKVK